jgi:predicted transcriptional regulator
VREIHDVLSERRPAAYTTTLTFLKIMMEKGLATRWQWRRAHRYSPSPPRRRLSDD